MQHSSESIGAIAAALAKAQSESAPRPDLVRHPLRPARRLVQATCGLPRGIEIAGGGSVNSNLSFSLQLSDSRVILTKCRES
jgi:hypothetical protein